MGQAKARGTFEERRAAAIIRNEAEDARRADQQARRMEARRNAEAAEEAQAKAINEAAGRKVVIGPSERRLRMALMLAAAAGLLTPSMTATQHKPVKPVEHAL